MLNEKKLYKVINNLLASRAKEINAPVSAGVHFDKAVYDLLVLCPSFETEDTEYIEIISDIKEFIQSLG